MNARALSIASRAVRPTPRCLVLRADIQRRFASSDRQPSNISLFYKTFTRPVAKVLLMAFFTYQLAYWAWVKLEQEEIMKEREDYIAQLEGEIAELTGPGSLEEMRRTNGGRWPTLEQYQSRLLELERKNKELLRAIAQAEMEGTHGKEANDQKKTSSWWKVW